MSIERAAAAGLWSTIDIGSRLGVQFVVTVILARLLMPADFGIIALLAFFSTLLLHQSGTSTSEAIRWSCHLRYDNLAEASFVQRGFPHPYVYRPAPELITPDFPSRAEVERALGRCGNEE